MADEDDPGNLRARLTRQGEDALGKVAQDLLENPLVAGALTRALEARERAVQAQEVAFGALNIPSAADIERLTRRVRQVSQRLEGIEDGVDRLDERLGRLSSAGVDRRIEQSETLLVARLDAIEERIAALGRDLVALREDLPGAEAPVPASQERLRVSP